MPNKEATLIVLHLDQSLLNDERQGLKSAFLCVNQLIAQNLLYHTKDDVVGLSIINCNKDYNSIDIFPCLSLGKAEFSSLNSLKMLFEVMNQEDFKIVNNTGLEHVLDYALETFELEIGKKAFNKRLIVITNGNNPVNMDEEKTRYQAKYIETYQLKTNIISIDFWASDKKNHIEEDNYNVINELCQFSNGYIKVYDKDAALLALSDFQTKKVKNISTFKGNFEIAPNCSLVVKCYTKTRKANHFKFNRYAKINGSSSIDREQLIKTENVLVDPEDTELQPVDKSQIAKGYYYGQNLIKISKDEEENMKFKATDKGMKLLGFVEEAKFPRHYLMSAVECVFADECSSANILAFNSIVEAMIRLNKLSIVRMVKAMNRAPKLCVLYPKKKLNKKTNKNVYMMYIAELPTCEDMREFNFGSIKTSTQKEREVMREYIEKLDIQNFENDHNEPEELLVPKYTPDPKAQVMYQLIVQKGMKAVNNEGQITVDDTVKEYLFAEQCTYQKVNEIEDKIKNTFKLKKLKEENQTEQKVYWKDILKAENGLTEEEQVALKNKDGNDEPVIRQVSANHPISDFRDMLSNRKEDLVDQAVRQMQIRIIEMVKNAVSDANYERAIECLRVLREGCINEDEYDMFNKFIARLKEDFSKDPNFEVFWKKIKTKKIIMITDDEVDGCPVSFEDAMAFLEK